MMKSAEATSLVTEIEDALASPLPSKGQELVERADLLVEEEFKAMAAEERRRAVLEGLAGLGYEVFEGMATAWSRTARSSFVRRPILATESSSWADPDRISFRCVP
ncbi:hypothetical protein ABIF86_000143 [Bradyrhizobium japonicum]